MNLIRKQLLILSLMIFVALPLRAAWQEPELSHTLTPLKQPVKAKNFSLNNIDDEVISLESLRGSVVLVNFWATWCPPCVREMPSMERVNQRFKGKNFRVLAINQLEDEDQVFAFTGGLELEPTFDILFDTNSQVARDFRIRGLPTTFLIDKQGMIRYRAIGGRDFSHPEITRLISRLMNE